MTSFYGSTCADNGKGALNTPGCKSSIIVIPVDHMLRSGRGAAGPWDRVGEQDRAAHNQS
eukprot:8523312-Pyramimonas_sp.AAC.1